MLKITTNETVLGVNIYWSYKVLKSPYVFWPTMYDQQTLTTSTYQNIIINSGWDYAVINNTTAVLHKLKHNQNLYRSFWIALCLMIIVALTWWTQLNICHCRHSQ